MLLLAIVLLASSLLQPLASAFSTTDGSSGSGVTTSTLLHHHHSNRRQFIGITTSLSTSWIVQQQQPANAATRDPKTGILLPSIGEIESAIPQTWDDDDNPFSSSTSSSSSSSSDFARLDSSDDKIFYSEPRFVEHVDQQAVDSITSYISNKLLKSGDSVLDLCTSWTSHISPTKQKELKRVAGLGMNAKEMESNPALTEWIVQDLNEKNKDNVKLPYNNESFDVVLCQLSIDYLIHPLEVMKEVSRVLKPGGQVAIIISNRLFITKAVGLWTGSDDIEHVYTVGSYLHYGGNFSNIMAEDLSTRKKKNGMIVGDPLYVITATKT